MEDDKHNRPTDPSSSEDQSTHDPSRRRFMKNTGMIVGGVAGGSLLGGLFTNKFQSKPTDEQKENKNKKKDPPEQARMFFTRFSDFVVLEQAAERIYPEDHNGPGAIELGVPYFIDRQLAGSWGLNAQDYRQAPFDGTEADAENSRLTRQNLFLNGLRKMNILSQERFNDSFDQIEEDQQIEILQEFESGNVQLNSVSSQSFFQMFRMAVIEGAYADPLYGGNIDMAGWKMKEFPGPVPSYINVIEKDEFVQMDPISLTDYQRKA